MDDAAAASLALDAYAALQSIAGDVAQVKGTTADILALLDSPEEVFAPDGLDVSSLFGVPAAQAVEGAPLPDEFVPDLMSFQYMHTVLFAFMLLALLLNLGATLWLAFSDKWRS